MVWLPIIHGFTQNTNVREWSRLLGHPQESLQGQSACTPVKSTAIEST